MLDNSSKRVFATKNNQERLAEMVHGRSGWLPDGTQLFFCKKSQPEQWCTKKEFVERKVARCALHRKDNWEWKCRARRSSRHGMVFALI